jgi:hypothetical protein
MQAMTRQRGMTFWGLLFVGLLFVFAALLFFKLLPPYLEFATVKTVLENVAKTPEIGNFEKNQIRAEIDRRFSIEDVKRVDLTKHLFVEKKPGATTIRIAYEVRVPLVYNVTALLDFDTSKTVSAR